MFLASLSPPSLRIDLLEIKIQSRRIYCDRVESTSGGDELTNRDMNDRLCEVGMIQEVEVTCCWSCVWHETVTSWLVGWLA
jgi:hypothetical protein